MSGRKNTRGIPNPAGKYSVKGARAPACECAHRLCAAAALPGINRHGIDLRVCRAEHVCAREPPSNHGDTAKEGEREVGFSRGSILYMQTRFEVMLVWKIED